MMGIMYKTFWHGIRVSAVRAMNFIRDYVLNVETQNQVLTCVEKFSIKNYIEINNDNKKQRKQINYYSREYF